MEKCSFSTQDGRSDEIKPESGIQSPDLNPNSDVVEELKRIAQEFENKNPGKSFIDDELFGIKKMNEKIEEQIRELIGDQMNS
jgi:hypothetical protein